MSRAGPLGRAFTFLVAGFLVLSFLGAGSLVSAPPVAAAPIAGAPITYCGDPDTDPSMDTGDGTMISCVTEITNTITALGPATGTAVVRVTECVGPANGRLDPADLTCATDEQNLSEIVTSVEQCNGVGYGGGNVLECSVSVINDFVGVTPATVTAATVNQCVVPQFEGLDKTGCDPYPATTTNATITQCNDSSYGGGQEDFICTASGTRTASLAIQIDQCNNSNYGGGSWLTCSTTITTRFNGQLVTPAPGTIPTPPTTSTVAPLTTAPAGTAWIAIALLALCGALLVSSRVSAYRTRD
jgi:hypothetical protein